MSFVVGRSNSRQNKIDIAALATIFVLVILSFARYLFTHPTPLIFPVSELGTDLPREIWPLVHFIRVALSETGELPLWRPYLLSGAPLVGHPIAPIFYPPNWLVLILPIPTALNLNAVLHLWWAGTGLYLFIRRVEHLRWEAAFFGGLAFALAPAWIARLSGGHWPMLAAIAWMPWAWFAARRMLRTRTLHFVPLLALALGAQALNHGIILILTVIWVGAVSLLDLILNEHKHWRMVLLGWAASSLLAFGLSAAQLLPFFELLPYSNRVGLNPAEVGFAGLPLAMILGLLFPPALRFPEWYLYPGVVLLCLAAYGGFYTSPTVRRRWISACVISIALAFGLSARPIASVLQAVPILSMIRIPSRWWIFGLFSLTVLASYGVQAALVEEQKKGRPVKIFFLVLAGVYAFTALTVAIFRIPFPFETSVPMLMALMLSAVLFLLPGRARLMVMIILLLFEVRQVRDLLIRPQNENIIMQEADRLRSVIQNEGKASRIFAPYGGYSMSSLAYYGLQSVDGYDSFHLAHYESLINHSIGCEFSGYVVGVPATRASAEATEQCDRASFDFDILSLFNVEYTFMPDGRNVSELEFVEDWEGGSWYRFQGDLPGRAFSIQSWKVAETDDCIEEIPGTDLQRTAVVGQLLPAGRQSEPMIVEPISYRPNEESFNVQAPEPGLLVRSETWAPGWKVEVDGQVEEVLNVNCALQGVWLEPGDHHVRFMYAPRFYALGLRLSQASVIIAAIFTSIATLRIRRRSNTHIR